MGQCMRRQTRQCTRWQKVQQQKQGVHKMAKVKVHETATKNDSERDGESAGARERMGVQRDGE